MKKNKNALKFIVPVTISFELAWPLTNFSKLVDNKLTKIGLVPKLRVELEKNDSGYVSLYCNYSDPNKKDPKRFITYERSFQLKEVKNFAKFREQDTILKNEKTYVPINILIRRFKDYRFGKERLEYSTGDEAVAFDNFGKYFRVKSSLHPDSPKSVIENISKILTIVPENLREGFDEGYIENLEFTPKEALEKTVQLWNFQFE